MVSRTVHRRSPQGAVDARSSGGLAGSNPAGPTRATARPLGPVATILLQEAWRLRLKLSNFRDIEDPNNPDGPLRDRPHEVVPGFDVTPGVEGEARVEYYRRLGVESHRKPPSRRKLVSGGLGIFPISVAVDRKIIRFRAEGVPIKKIARALGVGKNRVKRVLKKVEQRIRREMQMANKDSKQAGTVGLATGGLAAPRDGVAEAQQVAKERAPEPAPPSALATRALTDPVGLAREYAVAAAEILAAKQLVPQSKVNAIRLLKLAGEMLAG